jgi:small ligand-binding sensory domain FIST
MKWCSALSSAPETSPALDEVVERVREELGGAAPHFVLAFLSPHHDFPKASDALGAAFPDAVILGTSARSVIGAGRELEEGPGLALAAAHLPGVEIHPFHLRNDELPDPGEAPAWWRERIGLAHGVRPSFVLLADPFSCDAETLIGGLDASFPGAPKIGGLASAATEPGENSLLCAARLEREGVVGVALHGELEVDTIVAQGCRPIGNPLFVTRARDQLLFELDGRKPADVLQAIFDAADERDRELFRTSLFLGIEMKEALSEYRQGDFLVRNLVGLDARSGALVAGARLHDGQVVQFHLRDAETSARDLEERLARYRSSLPSLPSQAGALLFSCLGRGQYLYGEPDHDSAAFARHLGRIPLAGFFCNGEIGPVEGRTFLHGYTSAFGIFRRPRRLD